MESSRAKPKETGQHGVHRNRCSRCFGFRHLEPSPEVRPLYLDDLRFKVHVRPHQAENLGHPQSRCRICENQSAPRFRNVDQNFEGLPWTHNDRSVGTRRLLTDPSQRIGRFVSRNKPIPLSVFVDQVHDSSNFVQGEILEILRRL